MGTQCLATATSCQHSVLILKHYYAVVESLAAYLTQLLQASPFWPPSESSFSNQANNDQIHNLLATSYICVNKVGNHSFRNFSATFNMREVRISYRFLQLYLVLVQIVDQAQERLFRSKRSNNIITSGYRLVSALNLLSSSF